MRIALDAMGGDSAPKVTIAGAIRAARELPVEIVLVGQKDRIEAALNSYKNLPENISVVHASEVVEMHESPVAALRKKRDSSINIGAELLKKDEVKAFVSAGNTGAMVGATSLRCGLLPGIERPGIAITLPGIKGDTMLIDVGANIHPKPMHLLQYALMGEAYSRCVLGLHRPTIGLLNVGEEETKGTSFIKQTYALLEASGVNFVGNVEGHDLFTGELDIIVCEGFAGNVALKTAESLAKALGFRIKRELSKTFMTRLGAFFARSAFAQIRSDTDYAERGGAHLLGVNGTAIIAHGGSTSKAIKNAIRVAHQAVESRLNDNMVEAIRTVTEQVSSQSDSAKETADETLGQ